MCKSERDEWKIASPTWSQYLWHLSSLSLCNLYKWFFRVIHLPTFLPLTTSALSPFIIILTNSLLNEGTKKATFCCSFYANFTLDFQNKRERKCHKHKILPSSLSFSCLFSPMTFWVIEMNNCYYLLGWVDLTHFLVWAWMGRGN